MSVKKVRQCDCCGGLFAEKDFPETSEIMVCYSCNRSSGFERRLHQLEAENQKLKDANRWIPVSERLPAKTGQYWTTKQYEGVEVMVGQDLFISEYNEFSTSTQVTVIAWREIQDLWNAPYQGDV